MTKLYSERGKCVCCEERKDVFPVRRQAGGNYRRPPRWYDSKICVECAAEAIEYAKVGGRDGVPRSTVNTGAGQMSVRDCERAVELSKKDVEL